MDLSTLGVAPPPILPKRGFFSAIIGRPGCGKSTFAAQWPSPECVIDIRDQGMLDLASEGLLPFGTDKIHVCETFDKYKSTLDAVLQGPAKTVICESIIGIQALCHDIASRKDYDGDMSTKAFFNYQAGPITAADKYFQQLIDLMLAAQNRGKHILLVGHLSTGSEKNELGQDYQSGKLIASKAMNGRIGASLQNVFVFVNEPAIEKISGQMKTTGNSVRRCYCHTCPTYPVAKNRLNINNAFSLPGNPREVYLEFCKQTRRNPTTGYRSS